MSLNKINLDKRIRDESGAASYIELLIVFTAIVILISVNLVIVRIALNKMNVMDVVRSELRVIEIVGRVDKNNLLSLKEKLRQTGLDVDNIECSLTQKYYDENTHSIEETKITMSETMVSEQLNYRDKIRLYVKVEKKISVPMIGLTVKLLNIPYEASYSGTVQRYYKS